jgi:formylglycine-generating enzyme required for sulfatase activity
MKSRRITVHLPALLLALGLSSASGAGAPQALPRIQDCRECPRMVVIPAGSFIMGSPETEESRSTQEGPAHPVTIAKPFAVALRDVTRAEYARFVRETSRPAPDSCLVLESAASALKAGADWAHPGFRQSDADPVVCVDWNDAQDYLRWLDSKRPSKARDAAHRYRLLSEAEWEYADRAGTTTRYYWGERAEDACRFANLADRRAGAAYPYMKSADCSDGFTVTSPVGRFPPNPFGLHDMAGNVFQWVADCYQTSYLGAPADGSPWMGEPCEEHVIRGGSFGHLPRLLRSAYRFKDPTDHRSVFLGFRVARSAD